MLSKRRSFRSPARLIAPSLLLVASPAFGAEYYVAPTGSDAGAGTMAAPFASLQKGHDVAAAGDTVWIRGGTYQVTTPKTAAAGIALTKSGSSDANRIRFWAYPGEKPVFDFAMLAISATGYTAGFAVSGSFLHLKGLEIKNVPMNTRSNNGISASGGNNVFELLDLHHISGTGLFIHGGSSTGGSLVLNCDAHDNYDPTSTQGDGQNADGFGVHYQEMGAVTTLRGCRAWWNSDDGYDLINQEVPVVIENSWAMANGYIDSGMGRPGDGNGNGFKAGSSKTGIRHVIRNSLAWGNRASGFYANHSSGGNDWFNNTSYRNGTQYNMLASDPTDSSITIILMGDKFHRMRNNIGYPEDNTNMMGVDSTFNSWDLDIAPADADFVGVSDTGAMGPRAEDGSLPALTFLKLSANSRFLDEGTDVGLPFAGTAPDLGCFEAGLPNGGAAGAGGTGGVSVGAGAGGVPAAGGSAGTMSSLGGAGATGGDAGGMPAAGSPGAGGTPDGTGGGGAGTGGQALGGAPTGGTTSKGGASSGGSGGAATGGSGPGTGGASSGGSGTSGAAAGESPLESPEVAAPAGCGCRTSGRESNANGALFLLVLAALRRGARRARRGAVSS